MNAPTEAEESPPAKGRRISAKVGSRPTSLAETLYSAHASDIASSVGHLIPVKGFWYRIEGLTKEGQLVLKPTQPTNQFRKSVIEKLKANPLLAGSAIDRQAIAEAEASAQP